MNESRELERKDGKDRIAREGVEWEMTRLIEFVVSISKILSSMPLSSVLLSSMAFEWLRMRVPTNHRTPDIHISRRFKNNQ